jgi:large subunit ribosomal protein L28
MAKCELCGKKPSFGSNVSFSKRHTKRMWQPNVQKTTVLDVEGKPVQIKACTQCIRTMSKVR